MAPACCHYCRLEFPNRDAFAAHVLRFHGIEGLANHAADTTARWKHVWSVLRIGGVFVAVLLIFYLFQ